MAELQIDGFFSRAPASRSRAFSPSRLERINDIMRREVDRWELPGLVSLVRRRGEEHVFAVGTLAFDQQTPVKRDTIFRLASNTKPITSVAAMILVEECRLRLDDPVDDWLPELANPRVLRSPTAALDDVVPAVRAITVRDLLTYRSGYGEVLTLAAGSPIHQALIEARLPLAAWPFTGTADEFVKRLGALPLVCQPGERWLYHMSGEILGVLIARVSGKPLSAFLDERIFGPLGMKDTGFSVPASKLCRLPPCYRTDPSTKRTVVWDDAESGIYSRAPSFEGGAGGLVSTVDDMLAFSQMMLRGGATDCGRILSRSAVALMTTDQLTTTQKERSPFFPRFWDTCGWGLGVGVITHRTELGRSPGTFGWDGAFGTSCWADPAEDLVGVLMTQRTPATLAYPAMIGDFWTSVYQSIDD